VINNAAIIRSLFIKETEVFCIDKTIFIVIKPKVKKKKAYPQRFY